VALAALVLLWVAVPETLSRTAAQSAANNHAPADLHRI